MGRFDEERGGKSKTESPVDKVPGEKAIEIKNGEVKNELNIKRDSITPNLMENAPVDIKSMQKYYYQNGDYYQKRGEKLNNLDKFEEEIVELAVGIGNSILDTPIKDEPGFYYNETLREKLTKRFKNDNKISISGVNRILENNPEVFNTVLTYLEENTQNSELQGEINGAIDKAVNSLKDLDDARGKNKDYWDKRNTVRDHNLQIVSGHLFVNTGNAEKFNEKLGEIEKITKSLKELDMTKDDSKSYIDSVKKRINEIEKRINETGTLGLYNENGELTKSGKVIGAEMVQIFKEEKNILGLLSEKDAEKLEIELNKIKDKNLRVLKIMTELKEKGLIGAIDPLIAPNFAVQVYRDNLEVLNSCKAQLYSGFIKKEDISKIFTKHTKENISEGIEELKELIEKKRGPDFINNNKDEIIIRKSNLTLGELFNPNKDIDAFLSTNSLEDLKEALKSIQILTTPIKTKDIHNMFRDDTRKDIFKGIERLKGIIEKIEGPNFLEENKDIVIVRKKESEKNISTLKWGDIFKPEKPFIENGTLNKKNIDEFLSKISFQDLQESLNSIQNKILTDARKFLPEKSNEKSFNFNSLGITKDENYLKYIDTVIELQKLGNDSLKRKITDKKDIECNANEILDILTRRKNIEGNGEENILQMMDNIFEKMNKDLFNCSQIKFDATEINKKCKFLKNRLQSIYLNKPNELNEPRFATISDVYKVAREINRRSINEALIYIDLSDQLWKKTKKPSWQMVRENWKNIYGKFRPIQKRITDDPNLQEVARSALATGLNNIQKLVANEHGDGRKYERVIPDTNLQMLNRNLVDIPEMSGQMAIVAWKNGKGLKYVAEFPFITDLKTVTKGEIKKDTKKKTNNNNKNTMSDWQKKMVKRRTDTAIPLIVAKEYLNENKEEIKEYLINKEPSKKPNEIENEIGRILEILEKDIQTEENGVLQAKKNFNYVVRVLEMQGTGNPNSEVISTAWRTDDEKAVGGYGNTWQFPVNNDNVDTRIVLFTKATQKKKNENNPIYIKIGDNPEISIDELSRMSKTKEGGSQISNVKVILPKQQNFLLERNFDPKNELDYRNFIDRNFIDELDGDIGYIDQEMGELAFDYYENLPVYNNREKEELMKEARAMTWNGTTISRDLIWRFLMLERKQNGIPYQSNFI